ncbi:MAG: amidohydrolase family protein [Chloroflexi bacterium]|nr:amidohydrolase family protein [Chloroflexota bacterium]
MGMPEGQKAIDAMLRPNPRRQGGAMLGLDYLFTDLGRRQGEGQSPEEIIAVMDEYNVEKGLWSIDPDNPESDGMIGMKKYPDRLIPYASLNPHEGMKAIHKMVEWTKEYNVRAFHVFPAQVQLPHNDKKMFPLYSKACELDVVMTMNAGIPGPRWPGWVQNPIHIDEVCYLFPDLKICMTHGGEPWQFLCVKLMLKWPNLYYKTSAFAPRHYPAEIIHYANTRGTNKIMFATGHPLIDLARAMGEIQDVPLRDHVWAPFLRDNATKLFKM